MIIKNGFLLLSLLACLPTTVFGKDPFETATFAGGCFWCMEPPFEKLDGVLKVVAGYTGSSGENPTYNDYAKKGHIEAIQIQFDPKKISYAALLDIFWRQIDPTDPDGQFCDRGPEYRAAIFYHSKTQQKLAKTSKEALEQSCRYPKKIVTEIKKTTTFYDAEKHHQNYYKKNPIRYKLYRSACGRDQYLKKIWDKNRDTEKQNLCPSVPEEISQKKRKLSKAQLREKLTPLQYDVTQRNKTEPAFHNEYWDNYEDGIYVDIVSGEPLFSSTHKYKSGTGWPSFTTLLEPDNIVKKEDRLFFMKRTELRSKHADSHLGHLFKDGPPPTGLRYCINSAALKFIPKEDLKKEGYEAYLHLFQQ